VTEEVIAQLLAEAPAVVIAVLYVRHLHREALKLLTEIRDELRVARALRGGDRAHPLTDVRG
tara:strand:- start:82 stop:267 length:186 start_codon:yes stop_codon:yes gene_type:complete